VSSYSGELRAAQWVVLAAFGVVQVAIPYLLFAMAMRHVPAHEAALLTLIEAVLNPIWVWLFVGERASTATWAGGGLILVGLLAQQLLHRAPAGSHACTPAAPDSGP
jgi:drug/metabolite transporter (DMT)-like permease